MRRGLTAAIVAVSAVLVMTTPGGAGYGLEAEHGFEVSITNRDGTPDTQAGSHPFAYTTTLRLRSEGTNVHSVGGDTRDIEVQLPPGLVGDPGAVPTCPIPLFAKQQLSFGDSHPCPDDTQIGVAALQLNGGTYFEPVYNLVAPKRAPAE